MKLFIVAALLAFARADLFEELIKDEIDHAVSAVEFAEHSHITLRDLEDEERQIMIRELKTDIGQTLGEKLENVTQKLISAIQNGKANIQTLLTTFRQMVNDLKELGGKAGDYIKIAMGELKNAINTLKTDHLSPAVKLVVNFIKLFTDRGDGTDALVALDDVEDEVVAEVVVRALARRGIITDMFGKLWDTGKDIVNKLLTGLHGKFKELGQFMVELTKAHLEKAKPHIDNIKQLAQEFLDHAKEATKQTLNEALEFFGAYKGDLGSLWTQLKTSIDNIKAHLTPAPTGTAVPAF